MEDCIPASKWCVFKRLNMAAQVPSTPVTDMTNGLDQDHWRFNRWEEGTQVVLIRTDVNHADLMNESFHVMEVESEGQETGRVYKLRKWDDHGKIVLAHSTALMKASDFVLSQFTKLDASEKEYVTHNIFQMWPGLLAERQANAPTPVLVTTPRSYPNTRSPSPRRCSCWCKRGRCLQQFLPADVFHSLLDYRTSLHSLHKIDQDHCVFGLTSVFWLCLLYGQAIVFSSWALGSWNPRPFLQNQGFASDT